MNLLLNILEDFEIQKNQCYNLIISKKDLAEFAFNGLRSLNF
jgi:hypothetical protein